MSRREEIRLKPMLGVYGTAKSIDDLTYRKNVAADGGKFGT